MALNADNWFVLLVALLTWGGVFAYLMRLDRVAKLLSEEVRAREMDVEVLSSTVESVSVVEPLATSKQLQE